MSWAMHSQISDTRPSPPTTAFAVCIPYASVYRERANVEYPLKLLTSDVGLSSLESHSRSHIIFHGRGLPGTARKNLSFVSIGQGSGCGACGLRHRAIIGSWQVFRACRGPRMLLNKQASVRKACTGSFFAWCETYDTWRIHSNKAIGCIDLVRRCPTTLCSTMVMNKKEGKQEAILGNLDVWNRNYKFAKLFASDLINRTSVKLGYV
ncbi:hypothetical protein BC629DRAFT_1435888 [Irpex lacteus]|nr:hypothetical protein BC629DRAFT_1435888 [Irpex lacteus]